MLKEFAEEKTSGSIILNRLLEISRRSKIADVERKLYGALGRIKIDSSYQLDIYVWAKHFITHQLSPPIIYYLMVLRSFIAYK